MLTELNCLELKWPKIFFFLISKQNETKGYNMKLFFLYIYIYIYYSFFFFFFFRNSIFFSCNKSVFTLDLPQSQSANYSIVDIMECCLIGFLDQFVFLSMHACFSWRERETETVRQGAFHQDTILWTNSSERKCSLNLIFVQVVYFNLGHEGLRTLYAVSYFWKMV